MSVSLSIKSTKNFILLLTIVFGFSFSLTTSSFFNISSLDEQVKKAHYAVLVAGSKDFYNYRHQANVFHAYHVLLNNGVSKENIIVMAYDDIAHHEMNPYPGKVFNKPDPNGYGHDYYKDVVIDYNGDDVTPDNFLNILEGNAELMKDKGTGRVLNSKNTDNVFLYFADHGAVGLIAFPNDKLLYADEFNATLKKMHETEMYSEMVIYMEACESGSMFFKLLPEDIKIYATSASNPFESSFACYCNTSVFGIIISTCLGDTYSVVWLEDSDKKNPNETLHQQFREVEVKVKKSTPMEWGDKSFNMNNILDFQGINGINNSNYYSPNNNKNNSDKKQDYMLDFYKQQSQINSRDVKLSFLKYNAYSNDNAEIRGVMNVQLQRELKHREKVDSIISKFIVYFDIDVNKEYEDIDFSCLRNVVEYYKTNCEYSEYVLEYFKYFNTACEYNDSKLIINYLNSVC